MVPHLSPIYQVVRKPTLHTCLLPEPSVHPRLPEWGRVPSLTCQREGVEHNTYLLLCPQNTCVIEAQATQWTLPLPALLPLGSCPVRPALASLMSW